jgi:transposase-like protein
MIKETFVDETLIKINGQHWCLWIAYEHHINSCLSVHLLKERTIFICYQFFKQIRENVERNRSILMVLNGILMHVDG